GYTVSLLFFLVPAAALLWWLHQRRDLALQRRACGRTLVVLVPLGFLLDLLCGNAFFTFPNPAATLGLRVPAVGGPLPLVEFIFSFFFLVLVSLLWEATLALRYGWWGYRATAMLGLTIGAWSQLPVEAVWVWLAVSFMTVISYEVVKIWLATGKRAFEAFFGV